MAAPGEAERRGSGKPRDAETGLDDFGARDYSGARNGQSDLGRFMTPDWSAQASPVPYAKLDNPQSLNLYSYAQNNPVTNVDKDGHCLEDACIAETALAIYAVSAVTSAVDSYLASPAGQQAERAAGQLVTSTVAALSNVFESHNSDKPDSTPPAPVPTRGQALNDAKRDAGVPTSQQPTKQENAPLKGQNGKQIVRDGVPQTTREYTHVTGNGDTVVIQDHSQGHAFPDGGSVGPHFNVRPVLPDGTPNPHGEVDGTDSHYPYRNPGA